MRAIFPLLTPKRIAALWFTLAVGLALFLPTIVTHTSHDNPIILGRYSLGLALLVMGVLAGVAILLALAVLTLTNPRVSALCERLIRGLWKRPLLSFVLVGVLLTLFVITMAGQDAFFRNYTVRYQRGLLLGLGIIVFTLTVGLLTPRFANAQLSLPILASSRVRLGLIVIGSLLLSIILFGNMLNIQWHFYDDGIIMNYVGADGRVGLDEAPALIANSEIGRAFVKGRYRPTFWILRILESVLWGNNPTLYYVGRFAMLVLAVALFWWVLAEWLGLLLSGLVILLSFTYVFWYDVWGRLGAAESYAAPALALYLVTLVLLWRFYDHRLRIGAWQKMGLWLLNLVSGLVLIGAKENFLLALFPALGLLGFIAYRRRLDAPSIVMTALLVAAGIFIASSVGVALSTAGVDIYQNSVDAESRSAILLRGVAKILDQPILLGLLALVGLVMVASGWYVYTRGNLDMRRQFQAATALLLFFAVASAVLYLAQIMYYNGAWPSDNRYDFPGRLVEPFLLLVLGLWLVELVKIFLSQRWFTNAAYTALVLFLLGITLYRGYGALETRLAYNVSSSQRFTQNLNTIVQSVKPFPQRSLIFDAHTYWDHEAVVTTAIFLKGMGVTNPLFVRYQEIESAPKLPIEKTMGEWLTDMSHNGYVWMAQQMFLPLAQADLQNCFSIGFSGSMTDSCAFLVKVYP